MDRRVLRRGGLFFKAPPLHVSSLPLGWIIASLARAAARLGRVYCNLIMQQLMTLGSTALIATVRLFTSLLIYYVHSQAIKQEVRLLQGGLTIKQQTFGLNCFQYKTVGIYPLFLQKKLSVRVQLFVIQLTSRMAPNKCADLH